MPPFLTFINYSGEGQSDKNYAGYEVHGIMLEDDYTFKQLLEVIAETIQLETPFDKFISKYQVNDTYPPIAITDDRIRQINDIHSCALGKCMNGKRQTTANLAGECITKKFANLKTHYTPADVIRDMQQLYGLDLQYKRAWEARRKALESAQDNPYGSYQLIHGYLEELYKSNPGK
ncbi:bifunctional protein GlmU [Striga asiatica]|uniref:Bifunctional protein GlmU n=1 Tax=Striga asiatica TaxID=4170 RepID=A0A5A7NYK6_STRAF|nr:bifunctional protein GlmU [Striga asiatica]